MVQLHILTGRQAGTVVVARQFPFVVGRDKAADLKLEEEGVWERHLEFKLEMPDGFRVAVHPHARATINDQPVQEAPLKNGDLLAAGTVKIRFGLSESRQASLRARELLTWAALAALCAAQIALIYRVLP